MHARESSAGILVQTGLSRNRPGFYVCIEKNSIEMEKVNQSGIIVLGPVDKESLKLSGGVIQDNLIHIKNGYEGIHIRKCDTIQVSGNKTVGEAYYGIRVSGGRKFGDSDMSSNNNQLMENDFKELRIKVQDDYVLNHSDGKMFSEIEPRTAIFWFIQYTRNNKMFISETSSIIDEGENNQITYHK
jgi:hypothetical protein